MSRIGLFGGTFDPPHRAHVALAEQALAELGLDELRWIPAGDPWQKRGRRITPAAQRAAMVALAIEGLPRCVLDERELRRAGPSYTLDTVHEIRAEQPQAQLFLVVGADQLAALPTWHGWRELLGLVRLAVAGRPGASEALHPEVEAAARAALALAPMAISSTEVRARAAAGREFASLVPPAVAGYIDRHHLYREPVGT